MKRRRTSSRAFDNVSFKEAEATSLPVDQGSFDAALCVQVLEYVPDVSAALKEMRRALRTGGRVVLWDIDWTTLSWHSTEPSRMARILRAWDAHLAHPALPRSLGPRLRAAGFDRILIEGHAFATTDLTAQSYGGAILPLIERFVAGRDEIGEVEAGAWAAEQRELAERGESSSPAPSSASAPGGEIQAIRMAHWTFRPPSCDTVRTDRPHPALGQALSITLADSPGIPCSSGCSPLCMGLTTRRSL
jgi:hypothetical protein